MSEIKRFSDLEQNGYGTITLEELGKHLSPDHQAALCRLISEDYDFGVDPEFYVSEDGQKGVVAPSVDNWNPINVMEFKLDTPIAR